MAAMLVYRNDKIFLLGDFHFYANYVNKFSFVLYTNMAAMQTTHRADVRQSIKLNTYTWGDTCLGEVRVKEYPLILCCLGLVSREKSPVAFARGGGGEWFIELVPRTEYMKGQG